MSTCIIMILKQISVAQTERNVSIVATLLVLITATGYTCSILHTIILRVHFTVKISDLRKDGGCKVC